MVSLINLLISLLNGAERFKAETIQYREFEVTNPSQREQAIVKMAERKSNVIIGIGFAQADAINKVAGENPELYFAIVDSVVDQPNVQCLLWSKKDLKQKLEFSIENLE